MNPVLKSFSALADPIRLDIVERLMTRGELAAGDLAEGYDVSAPAISRHLRVLRDAGLIVQRAEGTRRIYRARPEGLRVIADWTTDRRAFWESSLDRLDAALQEEDDAS